MFHSYRGPGDVTRACKDEVLALPGEVDAISLMRVYQAEAFVEIRSGDYVAAAAALDSATVYGDKTPAGGALAVATSRLVVDWAQHGIRAIVEHLPTVDAAATALGQLNTYRVYLEAFACLAEGDFDGVSLLVEQALMRGHDRAAVYRAMGIEAAASVLSGRDSRYASMIEAQIRSMSIRLSDAAVPLALWWSAGAVATQPAQARNVIGSVLPRVRAGIEIIELFFPEPLSIYAGRADDTTLLEELAGWSETDSSPWSRAHWALTRGLAQEALGKAGARDVLSEAAAAVKELGCDYFAAFASERSNTAATAKRKVQDPDGKSARVSRPTARELQIARMVADGMSNRRIAEELVLSERTVEAHLANIFAKLDISSRVQLVALASRGEL
jgi:DNA-binding CsgD family transcriptional regulator